MTKLPQELQKKNAKRKRRKIINMADYSLEIFVHYKLGKLGLEITPIIFVHKVGQMMN
jgi:hypothetical protein